MMTVGSLFAGIGGFDAGFDRAGFRCLWQVERDAACLRVLERHWPDTLRLDDVAKAGSATLPRVDIITGGFPCQDLSVAGKRAGLAGKRSGLFHEAIRIVRELRPDLVVLENVPGLISSHGGHDFLVVLRSLRECGALDIAWRTLDSRYFNVAQRRERVFIVADFAGQRAGQILFESPCGCGDSPTRSETESRIAATIRSRSHAPGINPPGRGGEDDQNLVLRDERGRCNDGRTSNKAFPLHAAKGMSEQQVVYQANGSGSFRTGAPSCSASDDNGSNNVVIGALPAHHQRNTAEDADRLVTHSLRCEGADASEDGTGRGTPIVAFGIRSHNGCAKKDHAKETDTANAGGAYSPGQGGTVIGFSMASDPNNWRMDGAVPASYRHGDPGHVSTGINVRRLMPIECLRLQAFPDDWLDLTPQLSDSAKYRMIGNAVTVTVAEWIGRRMLEAMA